MNSIVSTDGRLAEIENNIHTLKKDVAHGLIEIGKNLIEAKTLVKHGEWSSWLENNVGFSQRSAQNYMRLARTFSGLDVSGLDASKLFLLQEMPEDERAGFLKEKDVSSMSVREMKAAIRGDCVPPIQSGSMADLDDEIWRAFDKESDATEYYVPVRLLKPIDRYEEYFGPRIGQEYIEYLELMELFHETSDGNELPIIITRDYTVLDEQEIVRAYRDLGIEEIKARYAYIEPERVTKGMSVEELKIYESIIRHIGRGMDAGRIKLTDSMKKFRSEMLEKGIEVFEYLD